MIVGALLGSLVGAAYGYVAQRGAFCMNSGFRFVIARRDMTKVKAYALAIAIQMLALPLVFAAGFSSPTYPAMFPVGAVVGGLIFGASMKWAGGCAAGVWYKIGAGSLTAVAATAGMAIGAAALEVGPLAGLRAGVQSIGAAVAITQPQLHWGLAPVLGVVLLAVLSRAAPGTAGSWSWRRSGLSMGLIGLVAWPTSSLVARDFGMAVVPGTVGLLTDPLASVITWDTLFVLGIPVGAFVAARRSGPIERGKIDAASAGRHFGGGLGLGVGASLAGGCTVGHGLTGVPLLAPGSILAIVSIFAGSALVTIWQQRRERTEPSAGGATG